MTCCSGLFLKRQELGHDRTGRASVGSKTSRLMPLRKGKSNSDATKHCQQLNVTLSLWWTSGLSWHKQRLPFVDLDQLHRGQNVVTVDQAELCKAMIVEAQHLLGQQHFFFFFFAIPLPPWFSFQAVVCQIITRLPSWKEIQRKPFQWLCFFILLSFVYIFDYCLTIVIYLIFLYVYFVYELAPFYYLCIFK